MAEYTTDIERIATALERIATSLEFFKDNGVLTKGTADELNTHSLAKTILSQGTSLTDAVKSGKAIQDAVKDLVADPDDPTKKVPNPPKTLLVKGVWNSSQRYLKEEMTSYNDKIWLCLRDNFGIIPEDDPSYWISPSCNDIKNIQDAPPLPKIANDIHSTTPEEGEVVCNPDTGEKSIGKKDGSTTPLNDNSLREVEGIPTAKNVGNWSSRKQYAKNDVVTYNNKFWVADEDPLAGMAPSENNGWYETKKISEIPIFYPPNDLPTPPTPTYTLTSVTSSVNEGTTLRFNLGGTNIPDGIYRWKVTNTTDFLTNTELFTITNNSGYFIVYLMPDSLTEGPETFTASVWLDDTLLVTSDPVTINDTSTTPTPPHTVWSASVHYSKDDVVEFCGIYYVAKVNTFRTIPSRSPTDWRVY